MPGTITTGNIPRLLQDGLNDIFGNAYTEHPEQWSLIFDRQDSRKAFEIDQQFEGLGLASVKPEGQDTNFDSQQQGFSPKYINLTVSKGIVATMEAMQDELYGQLEQRTRTMGFSMSQTKEVLGANILNRGFNSSFVMPGGDGQSLFSTAHINGPSGGAFSNQLAVPADLSETSLEDILIQINEATDTRGLRIALQGMRLITSPSDWFNATRILESVLQSGTANNDVNAIRNQNALRDGHTVNNFLTDPDAWFVKTNAPNGMKYFTRMPLRFSNDGEFSSDNMKFKAVERYSFGWTDPRGIYGSQGA